MSERHRNGIPATGTGKDVVILIIIVIIMAICLTTYKNHVPMSLQCEHERYLIGDALRYDIRAIEAIDITQQGTTCLATVLTYNATTQALQRDIVARWEVGELHPD